MDGGDAKLKLAENYKNLISIVVPTSSGFAYWQKNSEFWMSLRQQWPHFELLLVSSYPRNALPKDWVHFVYSGKTAPMARRFLGFSIANCDQVLFLDDDCFVEASMLHRLTVESSHLNERTLLAGFYSSPPTLGSAGVAFNELCNEWLKSGSHFLGGAFCLPNSDFMHQISFGDFAEFGGEEDRMACEILKLGGNIVTSQNFVVNHQSEKTWTQFFERAFRHGRNWQPRDAFSKDQKASLPSRLQKAPVKEWPWLVSHGLGLVAGVAAGRFEKLIKKTSPKKPLRPDDAQT